MSSVGEKEIFLLRHAESKSNVAYRKFRKERKYLSYLQVVKLGPNPDLSEDGFKMSARLKDLFSRDHFLESNQIQLVLHSPLARASETCKILFEGNELEVPIKKDDTLYEKSSSEYIYKKLTSRVGKFKKKLLNLKEDKIVIIGHAGFFQAFINPDDYEKHPRYIRNCEVVKCILTSTGQVTQVQTLYTGGAALLKPNRNE